MKVIGLGHRKFVGKDTCEKFMRNWIVQHPGMLRVYKISFADHLKDVCQLLYPLWIKSRTHYELYPNEKSTFIPELNMTVRDVWIKVGNLMRQMDEYVWIRHAFQIAKDKHVQVAFVPDVRYHNEVAYIKEKMGGKVFIVSNPRVEKSDDEADVALEHYRDWDHEIINDGTLSDLEEACYKVMEMHRSYLIS